MSNTEKNNKANDIDEDIEVISASDIEEPVSDSTTSDDINNFAEAGTYSAPDSSDNTDESVSEAPASDIIKAKKKLTTGDIVRYIILFIAICVFIFATVRLIFIFVRYKQAQNTYDDLAEQIYSAGSNESCTDVVIDGEKYPGINPNAQIDFDTLRAQNSSAVGWIEVPQCGISYPVAQYTDNDFYLTHDFNNDDCYSGAIYLDYSNNADLTDEHTFIYGHHMQDGSMFAGLLEYDSESFYNKNAKNNNNYFYMYLENQVNVYQVFSVGDVTYADNYEAYIINMADNFTIVDYSNYVKSLQKYDTGISISESDKILTLYTCESSGAAGIRHLVHGKLIATLDY